MTMQVKTVDLVLDVEDIVDVEIQKRPSRLRDPSMGAIIENDAVIYVSINGVTICRVYAAFNNVTVTQ